MTRMTADGRGRDRNARARLVGHRAHASAAPVITPPATGALREDRAGDEQHGGDEGDQRDRTGADDHDLHASRNASTGRSVGRNRRRRTRRPRSRCRRLGRPTRRTRRRPRSAYTANRWPSPVLAERLAVGRRLRVARAAPLSGRGERRRQWVARRGRQFGGGTDAGAQRPLALGRAAGRRSTGCTTARRCARGRRTGGSEDPLHWSRRCRRHGGRLA